MSTVRVPARSVQNPDNQGENQHKTTRIVNLQLSKPRAQEEGTSAALGVLAVTVAVERTRTECEDHTGFCPT